MDLAQKLLQSWKDGETVGEALMSSKDRHRSITIRGLVSPSEWDRENSVCRVSILTFDDDEYDVESVDAGRLLVSHAGQEVMARGHLSPGMRRRKVILVKSFTVFDPRSTETFDSDSQLMTAVAQSAE